MEVTSCHITIRNANGELTETTESVMLVKLDVRIWVIKMSDA